MLFMRLGACRTSSSAGCASGSAVGKQENKHTGAETERILQRKILFLSPSQMFLVVLTFRLGAKLFFYTLTVLLLFFVCAAIQRTRLALQGAELPCLDGSG